MIWTLERMEAARDCCASWAGTRHANRIAVLQQGVDCVKFVFQVVQAAGIIEPVTLPGYESMLGILRERNIMEPLMAEYFHCERAGGAPEFGDVCIFKCGDQSNHIGIVIDGDVWHVPGHGRCGPEAWSNVARRLQCLMRFTQQGEKKPLAGLTRAGIIATT